MQSIRVAIVGGGPGGLMAAYLLQQRTRLPYDITLFEATARLGGKIRSLQFGAAPVLYEAGAAELYDYSLLGPDPLRELVREMGLSTRPMKGNAVVMNDAILKTSDDIRTHLGDAAAKALRDFRTKARSLITPREYYESDWREDNRDPLGKRTFFDLLAEIPDESARKFIRTATHSDLATEPRQTNAVYGLHNYLMDEPDYMRLYCIEGGNERLMHELSQRITANIHLNHRVTRVEKTLDQTYQVNTRHRGGQCAQEFDYVIVALPNDWIPAVEWGGTRLARAMHEHHVYYDHPAHYLRVSLLFEKPFWRDFVADSFFMLDAFDGCCVYDETSRSDGNLFGVLGFLLAGEAAMNQNNLEDTALVERVLDSLPKPLAMGRDLFIEGRVHRFIGAVNGLPGGFPAKDPVFRHIPEPVDHERLMVVGDYLFDSTLNGVLDSADLVCNRILQADERLSVAHT